MDFGREDQDDGDVDSSSGLDGEKEDHETKTFKDILPRKLQEKQQNNSVKSEDLDQLKSWRKKLSADGFSVAIFKCRH